MGFPCPKCRAETVPRRAKIKSLAGGPSVGLLYFLLFPFFTKRFCAEHGVIERSEFTASQQRRMLVFPVLWLSFAVAALVGVGWGISRWIG